MAATCKFSKVALKVRDNLNLTQEQSKAQKSGRQKEEKGRLNFQHDF